MDKIVQIYDKRVLLLDNSIEEETLPDPDLSDVWVVNHHSPSKVKVFLKKIIRSENLKVYLKPVFLQREFKKGYEYFRENLYIEELCDGYIENMQMQEKVQLLDRVNYFVQKYAENRGHKQLSGDKAILQSSFDYYYTRQKSIIPLKSRNSLSGYTHPRIEAHFFSIENACKYSRVLLKGAFSENLLDREFIDTLHLCHHCGGGFLNYRQICPKCKSQNLKMIPLIHHFRCAYIGPKTGFLYKDQLICPKCSSLLLNPGVDYDSPGSTFICKNTSCNNQFQRPPILVSCVDCETNQSPHELVVRKVYKYSFTEKGLQHFLSLD